MRKKKKMEETKYLTNVVKYALPDGTSFAEYCKPFFLDYQVKDIYPQFLEILKKIGHKDFEGHIKSFLCLYDEPNISDEAISKLKTKLINNFGKAMEEPLTAELIAKIAHEFSFENTLPLRSEIFETVEKKTKKTLKKINKLSIQEKGIHEYFDLLTMQTWIRFQLTHPDLNDEGKVFLQQYFKEYVQGTNAFYKRHKFPQDLIDYVSDIKVPELEELPQESKSIQNTKPKIINVPMFKDPKKIYDGLKSHFPSDERSALYNLLRYGKNKKKLFFLGEANKLVDKFKKFFDSKDITNCKQSHLQKWIIENFLYENKDGKPTSFKERSVRKVMSTKKNPCKNPIK